MKWALLGASRGLGAAMLECIEKNDSSAEVWAVARQGRDAFADFSKPNELSGFFEQLESKAPDKVVYFAGGGPFGEFGNKSWKDHQWALDVSFLTPAKLVHFCLSHESFRPQQLVLIGSAVAETKADPYAASYAAAKHALKGLHSSVVDEKPSLDLRLFSPGYMDTDLLPKNAWPREQGHQISQPEDVANALWHWLQEDDFCGAKTYL